MKDNGGGRVTDITSLIFRKRLGLEQIFFDTRPGTLLTARFRSLKEPLYILEFAVQVVLKIQASSFLNIAGSVRLSSDLLRSRPRLRQRAVN